MTIIEPQSWSFVPKLLFLLNAVNKTHDPLLDNIELIGFAGTSFSYQATENKIKLTSMTSQDSPHRKIAATLLVAHPHFAQVLTLTDDRGVNLPVIELDKFPLPDLDNFNQIASSLVGTSLYVLKWPEPRSDSGRSTTTTCLLSYCKHDWDPTPPFAWSDIDAIDVTSLSKETAQYLLDIRSGYPVPTPAWATTSWHTSLKSWIDRVASNKGFQILGPMTQLKTWQLGCLWQIQSSMGTLYFKASAEFFASETSLTVWFSQNYPKNSPEVLAFDLSRNWLLMKDFQGTPLADVEDIAIWKNALSKYAQIQIEISKKKTELLTLGVNDRSITHLQQQYETLVNEISKSPDDYGHLKLERSDIEKIISQNNETRQSLIQLAQSRIPISIDHGDFHPGNIIISSGEPIYFDWSDGSLTHPFFSLTPLLNNLKFSKLKNSSLPETRNSLIESYLQPWENFLGEEIDLRTELGVTSEISNIHLACSYNHYIVPYLEQPRAWSGAVGGWLKKILKN